MLTSDILPGRVLSCLNGGRDEIIYRVSQKKCSNGYRTKDNRNPSNSQEPGLWSCCITQIFPSMKTGSITKLLKAYHITPLIIVPLATFCFLLMHGWCLVFLPKYKTLKPYCFSIFLCFCKVNEKLLRGAFQKLRVGKFTALLDLCITLRLFTWRNVEHN